MELFDHPLAYTTLAHALIVFAAGIRVVTRRAAPGVALAWLFLIVILPFAGAIIYLLMGERRIGARRARRIDALRAALGTHGGVVQPSSFTDVDWSRHPAAAEGLGRLGVAVNGSSTLRGSDIQLYSDTQQALRAIAEDIDRATTGVSMVFYIWNEGGSADEVFAALLRAAHRGVSCRVLVDAVGARPWLRCRQPGQLRAAGVEVVSALPVGPVRSFIARAGQRLHRKIVVVDGDVAWTGSMNLVDPRIFKRSSGVGEWVDAMARLRGPVVAALGATALGDWMLETGTPLDELTRSAGLHDTPPLGKADIQVVSSGPGQSEGGMLQMVLALIAAAREELVITTPYLVPDESVLWALRVAAGRGVRVKIVLPERVDSLLTRHASRSYFDELMDVGMEIFLYRNGLLHTKSIVVDGAISMFGTVNFDMRSLWLNYEVTLFVYDETFAQILRKLQSSYMTDSRRIDPAEWADRPRSQQVLDDTFRLLGPLL